jgi:hypothetical protein
MAGQPERAARLLGDATALRDAIAAPLLPFEGRHYERSVAAVRMALDAAVFTEAWAAGQAMPLEQAIAYALAADR